jgi:pyruvate formate lyase activating enzyme
MEGPPATPPATLVRAANIGRQAGLHYVYAGNLPGQVGDLENTRCPKCRRLLVERRGFRVVRHELDAAGICPACRTPIPGRWVA